MFAACGFRVGGRLSALVAPLLMLGLLSGLTTGCANTIQVTQRDIQQQIDSRLPIGTPPGMPFSLSLHSLQCDLLAPHEAVGTANNPSGNPSVDNNNVALTAQVQFGLLGLIRMESTAGLLGRLVYRADRGAFFIEQPQLTTLDLAGVPPAELQRHRTNLQQLLSSVLAVTPVFTLQDSRARNRIDRVEVQDRVMLVHLKP